MNFSISLLFALTLTTHTYPPQLTCLFLQGSAGMCKQHLKCNAYPLAFSLCELLELKGKESLFIPCHLTHWPFRNCSSSQTWNTLLGHCLMLPSLRPSRDCSLAEGLLLCPWPSLSKLRETFPTTTCTLVPLQQRLKLLIYYYWFITACFLACHVSLRSRHKLLD